MKRIRVACVAFILIGIAVALHAQTIRSMDFRNRNITDILLALADSAGASILSDETVSGTATFHFSDSTFEEALTNFTAACHLHAVEKDGVWYVSRILVTGTADKVSVNAEDTDIGALFRAMARNLGVTILYDDLPRDTVTIFSQDRPLREILEIAVRKYPEYAVQEENGAYYVKKESDSRQSSSSRVSSSSIKKSGDRYTMQIPRGNFSAVIAQLFRTGGYEYSLLQRNETTLENLYYKDKTFEELLRLVCEQGSSDYTTANGVYYIFEVQRRDVLKKLRETRVIQLRHLSVAEFTALLPADFAGASFIKADAATNSLYLTGSREEIDPIVGFVTFADEKAAAYRNKEYTLKYVKAADFIKLLPKHLAGTDVRLAVGTNSFLARVDDSLDQEFQAFIAAADKAESGVAVRLRYITSADLLASMPPSAVKEDIVVTLDPTLVFYRGTAERKKQFDGELALIDRPKPQIRYQILVVQYEKSNNLNWDPGITVNPSGGAEVITGNFSNIVNVNFDIISALGYRFAGALNAQLGEDRARVLADTTLNGLSGQEIKFENTNTFRYQDVAIDPETGKPLYTGTTREINSGLTLTINGWVSGDGMITMRVDAAVSKQGEASGATSTNPPPTSERSVNTQVRTRGGAPIIIGGLLQIEKTQSISRVPVLGYIPLLGLLFRKQVVSDVTSEMVIYIVPHVHSGTQYDDDYDRRNGEYLRRYGGGPL